MSKETEPSIRNYEEMLRLGANGLVTEREIQRRVANFSSVAIVHRATELQVRQVLNSQGVQTIWSIYYHAYARELGKLKGRELPRLMFDTECALLFNKWSVRGLSGVVLRDIATTVFNISVPAEGGGQV